MIRNLLATTAIATLLATGAYAQTSTPTPPATNEPAATPTSPSTTTDPAKPAEEVKPADGAAAQDDGAATDDTAQDSGAAAPADDTAQDSTTAPASDTAQDSTTTAPAADTAQDSAAQPADDTAQSGTATTGSDTDMATSDMPAVEGHLASNLIGARVFNGASDDAENIGEVNDIVIGKDGKAEFAIIGVGGFLGIGEKDVAIEYATLEWAERDGDMWLVIETTAEQLEAQPAFDRTAYDPEAIAAEEQTASDATTAPAGTATTDTAATAPATTAPATTGEATESEETATAEQPAADAESEDMAAADSAETPADKQTTETAEAPAAGATTTTTDTAAAPADDDTAATDQTQTGAIDRSTLKETDMSAIRAEDFVGTTVYGANEENIGEIGDVVLSEDGKVDAVLIDVGGFLGMGEKEIAVGMDNLAFMEDGDGNRYLYTEFTKEQLEAQPAYDEAGYAENRDTMRMSVQ